MTHRAPLIGITGLKRSGKDTAASFFTARGWHRVAFADAVREGLLKLDPIVGAEYFKGQCGDEMDLIHLSTVVSRYGWENAKVRAEVRRLLQLYGTEAGRDIHGHDCWVDIASRKMLDAWNAGAAGVVIPDVRFPNEGQFIKDSGGWLLRIVRPGLPAADGSTGAINGHASENQVGELAVDAEIENDGSIDDFHRKIKEWAASAVPFVVYQPGEGQACPQPFRS